MVIVNPPHKFAPQDAWEAWEGGKPAGYKAIIRLKDGSAVIAINERSEVAVDAAITHLADLGFEECLSCRTMADSLNEDYFCTRCEETRGSIYEEHADA